MEKEKNSSYLIYNIISFSQMTEKQNFFSGETIVEYELVVKHLETRLLRKSATILLDVE